MDTASADPIRDILTGLFNLASNSDPDSLTQSSIPEWDSFATVQIIMEIQNSFGVQLDLQDLEKANSYAALRQILVSKGVDLGKG